MSCRRAAARKASISSGRKAEVFGEGHGVGSHALQVRVRRMILGFDSKRQGLNGSHVERRNFFYVTFLDLDALFFVFESPQVQPVGAVDPVNQR